MTPTKWFLPDGRRSAAPNRLPLRPFSSSRVGRFPFVDLHAILPHNVTARVGQAPTYFLEIG